MLERVHPVEGQTRDDAVRRVNGVLRVPAWGTPNRAMTQPQDDDRDPAAPWWWESDEDASQSFLSAMGVSLDG